MAADDSLVESAPAASTKPMGGASPSSPPVDGALGTLDGRFRVAGEFARGGMSVIHEAQDTLLGRRVAIKTPRGGQAENALRLLREAAILGHLDHPLILPVYHSGVLPGGAPYFVTKLVDGESLEARARSDPGGWRALLRHVADVAEAVAFAHQRGIVHRDLKPANVLVDGQGRTLVIDWGLAREIAGSAPTPLTIAVTDPGAAVGTPGYWAPEQRTGAEVQPRADVYSIGAMLHRLITGRQPPNDLGDEAALDRDLAAAPPRLRALVARATARDPARRLITAAELAVELRRVRRPRRLILGAAAGVLLLAGGAAAAFVLSRGSGREEALARKMLAGHTVWWSTFRRVLFRLDGDRVRGVYDYEDGVIEGTLEGKMLRLSWCEAPYTRPIDHGPAEMVFVFDGDGSPAFHGTFRYATDAKPGNNWDMRPAVDRPPRAPDLEARLDAWEWRCPR